MAKDDYHIIVYQILAYLYHCLKSGEFPNTGGMDIFRERAGINNRYWHYILIHLLEDGYIEGASIVPVVGTRENKVRFNPDFAITPKGIGYLEDNSFMQKAKKFVTDNTLPLLTTFLNHKKNINPKKQY